MKELGSQHNDADYFMPIVEPRPAETIANMAIILIRQTDYLLYRQLKSLENRFLKEGGFSERLSAERRKNRGF